MAAGFETIGWILSVKDDATTKVKKIVDLMNKRVTASAVVADKMSKKVSEFGDKFNKSWPERYGALTKWGDLLSDLGNTKLPTFIRTITMTGNSLQRAFDEKNYVKAFTVMVRGLRELGAFKVLGKTIKGVTGLITGPFKAGLSASMFLARKAVLGVTTLMQRVLDISNITKGLKAMGGIAGVLLGPIGPLLGLFQPLIRMITDQFEPAMQTFSAIVSNAFGPFAMTLEIIARNLATAIVPLIGPIASFLEIAAVQIGNMIVGLLKGKPDKLLGKILQTAKQFQPVAMQVLNLLMDLGKQVTDVLLASIIKLIPKVIRLGVSFLNAVLPLIKPLTKLAVTVIEKGLLPVVESLLDALINIVENGLPDLIDGFVTLLDALIPLIEPLVKVVTTVVTDLFAPAIVTLAKGLGGWIKNDLAPFIKKGVPIVTAFLYDVRATIKEFNELRSKVGWIYALKVKVIDPFVKLMRDAIDDVFNDAMMRKITNRIVKAIKSAAMAPLYSAKKALQDKVLGENKDIMLGGAGSSGALFGPGTGISADEFLAASRKFADGASLVRGRRGVGIPGIVGEAGPEMILPLKQETVRDVLTPLLPDMKFKALDEMLSVVRMIERRISGTLRVDTGMDDYDYSGGIASVGTQGVGAW